MVYHTQVLPWCSSHERYCTNTLLQYYVIVCPFVVVLIGNVLVPKSIINDIISIFKKHRFFDKLHVQSTWLFICGTFIQMLMFKKNLQQSKNKKRTARIPNISNCAIWFFSYLFSMFTQQIFVLHNKLSNIIVHILYRFNDESLCSIKHIYA